MVSKICKAKGVTLVVDSTFMSPVLQNPLKLGADIVVHSMTKYIGGHSDVCAGAIMLNDEKMYDHLAWYAKTVGNMLAPMECYFILRSTKTLQVRVERACSNALKIAKYLENHPKIELLLYPGLPSHPTHKIAKKNAAHPGLSGGSGMVSFYIKGGLEESNTFLESVKIFTLAISLGAVESLIESPALMTHNNVPPAQRRAVGIVDNFIRMSVGIENVEDLINDLDQALD